MTTQKCRFVALLAVISLGLFANASAQVLWPCTFQSDDHDADGFGGEDNNCLVTVESIPPPQITDVESGDSVNVLRAYWLEVDIADKEFICQSYYESADGNSYMPYDWTLTYRHLTYGSPDEDVFIGRVVEEFYDPSTNTTTVNTDELWTLRNGYYSGPSPLAESRYVEFISGENSNTNAVRLWSYGFGDRFSLCKTVDRDDFLWPTVFPPTTNIADLYHVECADAAPVGDSYGWDGYGSCVIDENGENFRYVTADYVGAMPLNPSPNTSNCDYSDANLYGGWGWNSTTGESCPPEDSMNTSAECIDSDGDGWGWNDVASCVAASSDNDSCDYTDADFYAGWGWDPVARVSCPPE